ncbi:MAG: hypothetical protein DCC49_06985 [Acidobacteria bacterium]|nr:MAG: hypothetical protein DCC49_06985 [Acidobacteriota bacterium]
MSAGVGVRVTVPRNSLSTRAERPVRFFKTSPTFASRSAIHSTGGARKTFSQLALSASTSSVSDSTRRSLSTRALARAWLPRPSPTKSMKLERRRCSESSSACFNLTVSGRSERRLATSASTRSST